MQKKIILFILTLILITGCDVSPFNTKAKLSYGTKILSEVTISEGEEDTVSLEIPIVSENSVTSEVIEVKVDINGTERSAYISTKDIAADAITNITVFPFLDTNRDVFTDQENYEVKVKEIRFKDKNDNTISIGEWSEILEVEQEDENASIVVKEAENLEAEIIYSGDVLASIDLTWTDSNIDIDENYEVYRKKEGETYTKINVASLEVTSYSDADLTALTEGNKYYYYVVVNDSVSGKSSERSNTVTTKVLKVGNYSVENFTGTAITGTKFVKLTWDSLVDNADVNTAKISGYKIERKDNSSIYKQVGDIKTSATTEWIDDSEDLIEKTTYDYRVSVYDELGRTGTSDELSVVVSDISSPDEPDALEAELLSDFRIQLTWEASEDKDIKEYKVFAGKEPQALGTTEGVSTGVETTYMYSAIETDLNDTIYFKVQAYDENGNVSELSYLVSQKIDYTSKISAPKNLEISTDGISVDVIWDEATVEDGYVVREYNLKWNWEIETAGVITTETGSKNGIRANSTKLIIPIDLSYGEYRFSIKAIGENGEEGAESDGKYETLLQAGNYNVINLTANHLAGTANVELTWDALNDSAIENIAAVKAYKIYRRETSTTLFTELAVIEGKETVEYLDQTALEEKKTYEYKVVVVDEIGEEGTEELIEVTISDLTAPESPTELTATLKAGWEIEFAWKSNEEDDIKGYYIYKSTDGVFGDVALNTSPIVKNDYTYELSSEEIAAAILDEGAVTDFFFMVKAVDTAENVSESSNVASVEADYKDVITAPQNIDIKTAPESAILNWDALVIEGYDIIGYTVKYGTDLSNLKEKKTNSNTANIDELDAGVTYFRVSAYGEGKGTEITREFGVESRLLTARISADVATLSTNDVQVDLNDSGVVVKWKDSLEDDDSSIAGYVVYRASGAETDEGLDDSKYTLIKHSTKLPATEFGYQPDNGNDGWYVFEDKGANDIGTRYFYKIAAYKDNTAGDGYNYPGELSPETSTYNFGAPNAIDYDKLSVNSYAPYNKMRVSWGGYVFNDIDIAGFKVYISRQGVGESSEYLIGQTSLSYLDIKTESFVYDSDNYDRFTAETVVERSGEDWIDLGTLNTGASAGATTVDLSTVGTLVAGDYIRIENDYYELAGVDGSLVVALVKDYASGIKVYQYNKESGIDIEENVVELRDPTTDNNRIVFVKVAAINKAGVESSRTAYKWVDLVAPDQGKLNVQVESKIEDGGVTIDVKWRNLGSHIVKYHVYRYKRGTIDEDDLDAAGVPYTGEYLGETAETSFEDEKINELTAYAGGTNWLYAVVAEDQYGNKSVMTSGGNPLDGTDVAVGDGFNIVKLPVLP